MVQPVHRLRAKFSYFKGEFRPPFLRPFFLPLWRVQSEKEKLNNGLIMQMAIVLKSESEQYNLSGVRRASKAPGEIYAKGLMAKKGRPGGQPLTKGTPEKHFVYSFLYAHISKTLFQWTLNGRPKSNAALCSIYSKRPITEIHHLGTFKKTF